MRARLVSAAEEAAGVCERGGNPGHRGSGVQDPRKQLPPQALVDATLANEISGLPFTMLPS